MVRMQVIETLDTFQDKDNSLVIPSTNLQRTNNLKQ